ncbi:MAG: putative nicotinamide N-methyase [Halioglobus sp.]|jgi:predicted nicotinamide N-methyase
MSDINSLNHALQQIIPSAKLEVMGLPDVPTLRLYLLNEDYPQGSLAPGEVQRVMDNPLYWVFCWASGQALAQFLLQDHEWVKGKRVLDFGCGSGVLAIAAALAGAAEVIACDIDPFALQATRLNAELNGVALTLSDDYQAIDGEIDLIIVADVLYDRGNFPWLSRFVERARQVLMADSRVKDFDVPPYRQIDQCHRCTRPDLDESAEFRDVRIYLAE